MTQAAQLAQPRVRTEPNPRRVRVFFGGKAVADSSRTLYLFETGHLPVYYFPRADVRFDLPKLDVRLDLLVPSVTRTRCPYKGEAVYWSVQAGGELAEDIVWSYPAPIPEAPKIENLLAFYNEKTDITVDGIVQERPSTKWS
jgi:uncharacterized protein (DUF427 family)